MGDMLKKAYDDSMLDCPEKPMTSKIKCPVCQNNLHKINIVVSTCTNDKCKLWGSSIPNLVLEALAQAKQDLEIATRALKEIQTAQGRCWGATDTEIKNDCKYYAHKALEQIEHKVKYNE